MLSIICSAAFTRTEWGTYCCPSFTEKQAVTVCPRWHLVVATSIQGVPSIALWKVQGGYWHHPGGPVGLSFYWWRGWNPWTLRNLAKVVWLVMTFCEGTGTAFPQETSVFSLHTEISVKLWYPSVAILLFLFFPFEIGPHFCSLGLTDCSLCSPGWLRTLWLSFQAQTPKHWNSRCEPHTSVCIFPREGKSQRSVNTAITFLLPLTERFWCYSY